MSSEPYTAIQNISWPALHTKDGDHWLPRLILAPLSIFLKTNARTDTVNRLFDSKHVNDLRLITATAFVLALVVLGLASYSAWQVYDLDWNLKTGTTDAQQHIQRLVHAGALFFKLFAPALAIFGAVLTWAYQRGSNRLGVVDLFACEIDTTCRVVLILDTIESLRSADDDRKSLAHDSFPEAYFPILGSNSSDLQSLEAEVVVNITAFYTYIKTAWDAFRRPRSPGDEEQRNELTRNVIYMLYLGLESARRAVDDLVEFEPTHTERLMVILLSELTAYRFLLKQYNDKNEIRHRRLALRGCCYGRLWYQLGQLMNEQRTKLLAGANNKEASDMPSREEEQWAGAVQLWPALEKSLEQTNSLLPFQCSAAEFRLKASRLF